MTMIETMPEMMQQPYPHRVERYVEDGHLPTPSGAVGLLGGFADSIDKYAGRLQERGYDIPTDPNAEFRVANIGTWDGSSYEGERAPRLDLERIVGEDGVSTLVFTRHNGPDVSIVTLRGYRGGHSWNGYSVFSRVGGRDFMYTSDQAREDTRVLRGAYSENEQRGRGERLGHAQAIVGDIVHSFDNSALDRAKDDNPRFDRPPSGLEREVSSTVYESAAHTRRSAIGRAALRAIHTVRNLGGKKSTSAGRVRL